MRKIENFIRYMEKSLQRKFSDIEYFPCCGTLPFSVRVKLPAQFQLEPVFEIRQSSDKKFFISSFYILNCQIAGQYGITADDPCAIHWGTYGEFEEKLPHFQSALQWLDELQCNNFSIPEERKYDAVDDLLARLEPEVLAHGWFRTYNHAGNWQQMLCFPGNEQYEAGLEVSFYHEYWHCFFELISKSPDVPREKRFDWHGVYSRENAHERATVINQTLKMLQSNQYTV